MADDNNDDGEGSTTSNNSLNSEEIVDITEFIEAVKTEDKALIKSLYKTGDYFLRAVYNGSFDIVKWMIETMEIDIHMHYDEAFYAALHGNHFDTADFLQERGIDIDKHLTEAMFIAVSEDSVEIVKYLHERKGADLEAVRRESLHPHSNIRDSHANTIISTSPPPYCCNKTEEYFFACFEDYDTSLCIAAQENSLQVADYLLQKNANVNANDGGPLRYAVRNKSLAMVELLLQNNASTHNEKEWPMSALAIACGTDDMLDILVALEKAGADLAEWNGRPMKIAAEYEQEDSIRFLLSKGIKPDPTDEHAVAVCVASQYRAISAFVSLETAEDRVDACRILFSSFLPAELADQHATHTIGQWNQMMKSIDCNNTDNTNTEEQVATVTQMVRDIMLQTTTNEEMLQEHLEKIKTLFTPVLSKEKMDEMIKTIQSSFSFTRDNATL